MTVLFWLWAVLTAALTVLLIYRSALTMHEDDQIFLDSAESHLEQEQQELSVRMERLRPPIQILAVCSGLLIVVMAGLWILRAWRHF